LLKPQSIALVGASKRDGSPGQILSDMVINSTYGGNVYPVNPGYNQIYGQPCYPDLSSLPETVDHVVLAVSNARLEQILAEAIAHGARAATIYENCFLEDDTEPALGTIARGNISYIAQSGSAFTAFAHNGCRLKFNFCVSSGNEFVTTVADYMNWSLEQDDTRVIGLFLETVRNPDGFVAALEKATQKDIPVVVLKVGRSPLGAKMAHTHTGAIAGDDAAFEALFRKFGVTQVSDFGEMAATLMMFQYPRRPGSGELASIQESGGFRELVTDLAHDLGIPFAEISDETKNEIQQYLEPGLRAENPLDAWGSNFDFENRFYQCMSLLANDPAVAAAVFFTNFRDGYYLSEAFFRVMQRINDETSKPIAMANCFGDLANQDLRQRTSDIGIPLIDGSREALLAVRHVFSYRNYRASRTEAVPASLPENEVVERWHYRIASCDRTTLGEQEAMALLSDFAIPVPAHARVIDEESLLQAARKIGFPVVLKTAEPGIQHKTEHSGVVVNIRDEVELAVYYRDFEQRLGPAVLVSEMAANGSEVGLGLVNDPQFGPFVMVSAGGIFIELISDRALALAPVSREEALVMISSLRINTLLSGTRGRPTEDIGALAGIIVALSNIGMTLKDAIAEIDINPVIVSESGAVAVDALVVKKGNKVP
jgi:acyl-CoA synthetase (NDP forming)